MGYLAACFSVILVSVAQLVIKYALSGLPPIRSVCVLLGGALDRWLLLAGGLGCYLLSLVAWYFTLQRLALGKAYAFLSLSYGLVWCGALLLPYYSERFSWLACMGVLVIIIGVLLVCWPRARKNVYHAAAQESIGFKKIKK